MDLKLKVRKTIEANSLIDKGDKVVLGLSGGPDSVCLLSILSKLQKTFDFQLFAFHVNHCIRGEEADGDEAYAKSLCETLGVEFASVKIDVPALAKTKKKTEEEMGREVRIEEIGKFAQSVGANKIALAHNKNDQAETVLMRIIRGTGVHGLCAMEYKREDGLIRPLLDAERTEIESYCEKENLNPHIDHTNNEAEYTRNKIRLKLLPQIAEDFNPAVIDALVRLSASAKADDAALNKIAEELKTTSVKELAKMDDALFTRVVNLLLKDAGLYEDISAVHINALKSAVQKNVGGKVIEFPKGYRAEIKKGKVIILHG